MRRHDTEVGRERGEREEDVVKSFLGENRSFVCCLHFGCSGQSKVQ